MSRSSLALLLLGLSVTVAQTQQPPATPLTYPLVTWLLPQVEDENFGKELKLTPEQVKKLVAVRQKQWGEQYTTAPADYAKGRADRTKATVEAFKEGLSAEQHKRALQLAAQTLWVSSRFNRFGGDSVPAADLTQVPASSLAQFPELADPLNLSDEQKKLVAGSGGRFRTSVFLTAEQSKVAKELLGEPRKTGFSNAYDTRLNAGGFDGPGGFQYIPGPLGLTQAKDVRTEIGMTDEQVKALAPLVTKWQAVTGPGGGGQPTNLSPETQAKKRGDLTAETDKAVAATLKPEQLARLRQIEKQQQANGRIGGPTGLPPTPLSAQLRRADTKKALALTADQDKALAAADKALDDGLTTAVTADTSVEDAVKAATAAHAAHEKAAAAVLTADQTKALDGLMGKPFTGNTRPDGIGGPPTVLAKVMRAAMFGNRQVFELRLLAANKPIQDELGLTPEQVKKVAEKESEATRKFGGGVILAAGDPALLGKAMTEQSEFFEKALADTLTAEQGKRYRELMLQRAEGLANRTGPTGVFNWPGAIGYPGVAEAVKLTAEQKKKLLDDVAKPADVLTADQKTAIKAMLGKEFKGGFNVGPGVGPGGIGGTAPTTPIVLMNVGWDTFKITPEQHTKLVPVANQYQLETTPTQAGPGGGGFQPVEPAKQKAADEKLAKAVANALTADQVKRIEQVRYNLYTTSPNTDSYLLSAEIAKALDLTDEQKAKIAAVFTDNNVFSVAARRPGRFGGGVGPQTWSVKLTEKTTAKAMGVLSEAQKAKWKGMTGNPVPNLPRLFFDNFGGGGFGGPF